jgi:hypothetical protein
MGERWTFADQTRRIGRCNGRPMCEARFFGGLDHKVYGGGAPYMTPPESQRGRPSSALSFVSRKWWAILDSNQ